MDISETYSFIIQKLEEAIKNYDDESCNLIDRIYDQACRSEEFNYYDQTKPIQELNYEKVIKEMLDNGQKYNESEYRLLLEYYNDIRAINDDKRLIKKR